MSFFAWLRIVLRHLIRVLNFTHISQLNKSVTVSKKQLISAFLQLNSPNVGIIEDNMKALETVSRNMCCGLCSHEAILFCLSFMIEISYLGV